ncbi:MAG: Crp/Fnr family transcriptional regulator, partial [Bacteroidetes bacterium]|nr:Crp/Fnr family transcriptional regulator [Bacteroidota bacterium]
VSHPLRGDSPGERYQYLLQHTPELLQWVPAKYIASYLDIDEATMSRLRRRK